MSITIGSDVSMQNVQRYQDNLKTQDTKAAQTDTRFDTQAERDRIVRENEQNAIQQSIAQQFGQGQSIDYKI